VPLAALEFAITFKNQKNKKKKTVGLKPTFLLPMQFVRNADNTACFDDSKISAE
jgi:hypothetical protein